MRGRKNDNGSAVHEVAEAVTENSYALSEKGGCLRVTADTLDVQLHRWPLRLLYFVLRL